MRYDNPLASTMPSLYDFQFGQNKREMLSLSGSKHNLQPKQNCDTWNPTVRFGLSPSSIVAEDYELNGEQCGDEWDTNCLRNLRPPGGQSPLNPGNSPLNAIEAAMVATLRQDIADDVYRIAYFGDKDLASKITSGAISLAGMTPEQRVNFTAMMSVANGWWPEIEARTLTSNVAGKIAYVDSNDGTYAGNATLAVNVTDFLDQMRMSSSLVLRNWRYGRPAIERPKFLVQSGIFRAYKRYLQGLGTEAANQFILNGETVPGVLQYDGQLVIEVPEWDMYDAETGQMSTTTGLSLRQRALYIADMNLAGLANLTPIASYPEAGLIVQRSPVLRDKGKVFMYANMGFGFGVAQPQLVTAAYNSSTTFDVTP